MQGPIFRKEEPKEAITQRTVGSQRISIELEDKPKEAAEYAKRYNGTVADIVETLQKAGVIPLDKFSAEMGVNEERFFTEVWRIMNSKLGIKYGIGKKEFLSEALDTGEWDCDNSTFLVFDVGRALGMKLEVAVVSEHVLIAGKEFFFETVTGKCDSIEKLSEKYPVIYGMFDEDEKIMSIVYNNRGSVYGELGEHEKAIKDFDKALEINPNDAEAYHNRGVTYSRLGRHEKAIQDFDKALEINPKYAKAYHGRGNAYDGLGRHEEAIEEYGRAIELNPEFAEAYYNMGTIYGERGEYKKAIKNFSRALDINPKLAIAHYSRGLTYMLMKEEEKAREDFKKAEVLGAER